MPIFSIFLKFEAHCKNLKVAIFQLLLNSSCLYRSPES